MTRLEAFHKFVKEQKGIFDGVPDHSDYFLVLCRCPADYELAEGSIPKTACKQSDCRACWNKPYKENHQ